MSSDDFTFMMMFLSGTCAATSAFGYLVYRQVKEMKSEFEKMSSSVEELFDRIDNSSGRAQSREEMRGVGLAKRGSGTSPLEDDVDNDPEVNYALQEEKTYPTPRQIRLSSIHSFSVPASLNSSTSYDNFRRSSSFPIYSSLHEIVSPVYD